MSTPQALILQTERSQDMYAVVDSYRQKNSQVIEIVEHKKDKGVAIGIFIEDIRMIQEAVRTSQKNQHTIITLADAAKMTQQAQNALLKLLEEPRERLHIILITPTPEKLLPTVRSRCQLQHAVASTEVNLPPDLEARIKLMAGNNVSERQRLAQDAKYFELQQQRFSLAKAFLSGARYERLKATTSVKESREEALEVIHAALVLARFMLQKQVSTQMYDRTKRLLAAEAALERNGNVRLWLLSCVL